MDLSALKGILDQYGTLLVTANSFLHEAGVPLPLLPTLLVAGARAVSGTLSPAALVVGVVIGTIAGNALWYVAGRRHGPRVLKLFCRLAITPDSCVGKTEATFQRWGAWSLSLGKFIPGVSLVASPLAGATGMPWPRFVLFNAIGGLLYALAGIVTGMVFHDGVDVILAGLSSMGPSAIAAVSAALILYLAWKAWRRYSTRRELAVPRITVEELAGLMGEGEAPVIVDLRGPASRDIDGRRIPGAVAIALQDIEDNRIELPRNRHIVLYCACPNEASAAQASRLLQQRGHASARPLLGGLDAWAEAGMPVESAGKGDGVARRKENAHCSHVGQLAEIAQPRGEACLECLESGDRWVHLRVCLACGHVGCCDDSRNRHATRHFEATGHPLIASLEAGEDWTWCYVDQVYVDRAAKDPSLSGR
jgi:membrane protein DedA with SNARE-associated domain/rhodanese-related sulfurtransferase